MLSYRHAFHAGNHADVLKHFVLVETLRYLAQKDKAFWYIDTHAGAGLYGLDSTYAEKLGEFRDGIGRLWQRDDLPEALKPYVEMVRALNRSGELRLYPGSPYIAQQLLRDEDRMKLFELHPTDVKLLYDNFRRHERKVQITAADGYAGLKALMPPPPRRALTLIDPSYEVKGDYPGLIRALDEALQRFPTGTYAVWYPLLAKLQARELPDRLKRLPAESWLHVTLTVKSPSSEGIGMHGSGMYLINPPWTLAKALEEAMPYLVEVLGQDSGARFTLEHGEGKPAARPPMLRDAGDAPGQRPGPQGRTPRNPRQNPHTSAPARQSSRPGGSSPRQSGAGGGTSGPARRPSPPRSGKK